MEFHYIQPKPGFKLLADQLEEIAACGTTTLQAAEPLSVVFTATETAEKTPILITVSEERKAWAKVEPELKATEEPLLPWLPRVDLFDSLAV